MTEVNFLVKKGLTVPKGSASTPSVIFGASDPNTGLYSPGADQVAVATNGSGRLFINASGSISTSSTAWQGGPVYQLGGLQIGASTYAKALLQTGGTSRAEWFFDSADNYIQAKSGGFYISNTTANPITFGTNATERLRITSAGLVGIGTSSPLRLKLRLEVLTPTHTLRLVQQAQAKVLFNLAVAIKSLLTPQAV
jgi:hypothetical protein